MIGHTKATIAGMLVLLSMAAAAWGTVEVVGDYRARSAAESFHSIGGPFVFEEEKADIENTGLVSPGIGMVLMVLGAGGAIVGVGWVWSLNRRLKAKPSVDEDS